MAIKTAILQLDRRSIMSNGTIFAFYYVWIMSNTPRNSDVKLYAQASVDFFHSEIFVFYYEYISDMQLPLRTIYIYIYICVFYVYGTIHGIKTGTIYGTTHGTIYGTVYCTIYGTIWGTMHGSYMVAYMVPYMVLHKSP